MNTQDEIGLTDRVTRFSEDRRYRYTLWRQWGDLFTPDGKFVAFCCLNPSTADETLDDPTIRRCIGFSKRWGYSAFCMVNLFAFRATDPNLMMMQFDPVGPENNEWIQRVASESSLFVCAWGVGGGYKNRDDEMIRCFIGIPTFSSAAYAFLRTVEKGVFPFPLLAAKELDAGAIHVGDSTATFDVFDFFLCELYPSLEFFVEDRGNSPPDGSLMVP